MIGGTRWPGVRAVLDGEVRAFIDAADALDEETFAAPTRLPAWNVAQLVAHVWRDLDRVRAGLAAPPPGPADTDAVTYWRSYDPRDRGPSIAEHAVEIAAGFDSGAELVADLRRVAAESTDAARGVPDERVVATWGPAIRLDELLATRVLELAIHGLDLADAVGREPWLTASAAALTRAILVRLLGAEPPAVQRMPDVAFFELASGRRPLGRRGRIAFGPYADRFPLLG